MQFSRAWITGAGGMLGNAIYPYFRERFEHVVATDKQVSEAWMQELDVRDTPAMRRMFKLLTPDLVLHLAAETDLEFCETHPDVAIAVNDTATRELAQLCEEYGATLVYISTAGTFDGLKEEPYTEEDEPRPIMVYGQTKLDGEHHVREFCSRHYVVRAGWMVGGRLKDHKFVSKIIDQIKANQDVIYAVSDKWGTPTYTHDFALNLFRLLESGEYGTYHMVCEGSGTRYDVAREILRISGREDIRLEPVDSEFFAETYFVPRPRSEIMVNANLARLGINLMRPWKEALHDYLVRGFPEIINRGDIDTGSYEPLPEARERRSVSRDAGPPAEGERRGRFDVKSPQPDEG